MAEALCAFEAAEIQPGMSTSAKWSFDETDGLPLDLEIVCATSPEKPAPSVDLRLTTSTTPNHDVERNELLLPWAPDVPPPSPASEEKPPPLKGGDPVLGREVFLSKEANCAACHRFGGAGNAIGPDLSNLNGKDLAWVFEQLVNPSSRVAPEFQSYTIVKQDGQVLSGLVRTLGFDQVRVISADATETSLARSEIEEMRPSATSIMPVGLGGVLGPERLRNLISYLRTSPELAPATRPD
jgi:putative heme-binding domain-containing protein